jgi:hypothetical protein
MNTMVRTLNPPTLCNHVTIRVSVPKAYGDIRDPAIYDRVNERHGTDVQLNFGGKGAGG